MFCGFFCLFLVLFFEWYLFLFFIFLFCFVLFVGFFCWFLFCCFFAVVVLFCFQFLTHCFTGRSQAKWENTNFLSQSPFWKYSNAPPWRHYFLQLSSLVYLQASLLTANPALALPRQGEIKVNTFGVFFADLKIKNMRRCNCREYRDPFDNLSTEVIDKNETDQLSSFIPADVSKESPPSQEYLFPIALPHPVPNIACKLLMTI